MLEAIVSPPAKPNEVPDARLWRAVESSLTKLPTDYRTLLSRYGTGSFDSFIWIFNPAARNPHLNLEQQVQEQLHQLTGWSRRQAECTLQNAAWASLL